MIQTAVEVKTFPLKLQPSFSEMVSKAAKQTPLTKHDWIVEAVREKLERDRAV